VFKISLRLASEQNLSLIPLSEIFEWKRNIGMMLNLYIVGWASAQQINISRLQTVL